MGGSEPEYERLISSKFECLLEAASQCCAKVLIMPDVGCGVFENDPQRVGRIFGDTLMRSQTSLENVICVGNKDFYHSAMNACAGAERAGPRTPINFQPERQSSQEFQASRPQCRNRRSSSRTDHWNTSSSVIGSHHKGH